MSRVLAVTAGVAVLATAAASPGAFGAAKTKRVSITSAETQVSEYTNRVDVSADGKLVVMASQAALAGPDVNGNDTDIFIRNRAKGTTRLISQNSAGDQGDDKSDHPAIDASGRFVVFTSRAKNLAPGVTSGNDNIYLRDRKKETTRLISKSRFGGEADKASRNPAISANGRYIAFESDAADLVAKDNKGHGQIYVYDRKTHKIRMRSVTTKGKAGNGRSLWPSLSGDGSVLVYTSRARNLSGKDGDNEDVFARYPNGKTVLISRNKGRKGNGDSNIPVVSTDGRYIVYSTLATNLIKPDGNGPLEDVLRFDRRSGKTKRVGVFGKAAQGRPGEPHGSSQPDISATGRFLVFTSYSDRMGGDTADTEDVFIRDLVKNKTRRVSNKPNGDAAGSGIRPRISQNRRWVAFASGSGDLVAGDSNGVLDAFIRGPY